MPDKYQHINPSNARIFIDYDKPKEERVRFEYISPDKYRYVVVVTLLQIWIYINIWLFYLIVIPSVLIYWLHYFATNSGTIQSMTIYETFIKIFSNPGFAMSLGLLIYILAPPIIGSIMFLTNKKLLAKFPTINWGFHRFTTKTYNAEFTSVPENNVIELPLFKNIMLDYEAKGEFAHYLKKVNIIEHPLTLQRVSTIPFMKKKVYPNEWLWKAQFIFEKNPKHGKLSVRFM